MGVAIPIEIPEIQEKPEALEVTLWQLVWAVSEVADTEVEVVATVASLIETGKVRLCGNFAGAQFPMSA